MSILNIFYNLQLLKIQVVKHCQMVGCNLSLAKIVKSGQPGLVLLAYIYRNNACRKYFKGLTPSCYILELLQALILQNSKRLDNQDSMYVQIYRNYVCRSNIKYFKTNMKVRKFNITELCGISK